VSLKIIERWHSKLPDYEKSLPLIKLEGITYSPQQILQEVRNKTPLGEKLQKRVEGLRFGSTLEDEETAEERLVTLLEERPVRVAALTTPEEGKHELTSEELIERIKKKDKVGRSLLRTEVKHMTAMTKV